MSRPVNWARPSDGGSDEMVGVILGAIFFGLVLGPLARIVIPGQQDISIATTVAAGAAAALVGGALADVFGLVDNPHIFDIGRIVVQLVCAIVAILLVTRLSRRPRQRS